MAPSPSKAEQSGAPQQAQVLPHGLSISLPLPVPSPVVATSTSVVAGPDNTVNQSTTEPKVPQRATIARKPLPVVRFVLGAKLGVTPFPKFQSPTPTQCYDIHRLLTQAHGEIKTPEEPEMPSMTIAGCGNVPFVLEALIRTLISQNTTMAQADRAIVNLINTFPRITQGEYAGSLDWNKVRLADPQLLINAIRPAGNHNKKSKYIKSILEEVWEDNEEKRRQWDAIKDKHSVVVRMERNWKKSQNELEISAKMDKLGHCTLMEHPDILTLDYLHSWDTPDAFERLNKFQGIGVKTAACVLLFCMQRPVFAVDTHVWRFCRWLGWIPQSRVTANNTFAHCDVRVPDELKYSLHQLMIIHGQKCRRCNAKDISTPDDPPCVLETRLLRSRKTDGKQEKTVIDDDEEEEEEADDQDTEQVDVTMEELVNGDETIIRSKYFTEEVELSSDMDDTSKKRQRSTSNDDTTSVSKKTRSLVDTILAHRSRKRSSVVKDDDSSSSDGIEIVEVHTGYPERIGTTNNKNGGPEVVETKLNDNRISSPIFSEDNVESDGGNKKTSKQSSAQSNDSDADGEYESDSSDEWPSRAPSAAYDQPPPDDRDHSSDDEDNKPRGSPSDYAEESSSDEEESEEEEEEQDESWPAETDNEDDSDFEGQSSEDDEEYGRAAKRFKPNARELDR